MKYLIVYLVIISLVSAIVTVADKKAAQAGKRRVPEATLFLLAALGGSVAMFLAMKWSHHKTQHVRFMLGIPLIIIIQVVLLYYLIFYVDLFGWV